jgi:hypothetical protein
LIDECLDNEVYEYKKPRAWSHYSVLHLLESYSFQCCIPIS